MAELAASADCPKCGAPRSETSACPRCGLLVDRWPTFAASEEAKVTAPIRDAWTQLVEHWGEPKRHAAMLELAATHGVFAWVAGRYREKAKTGDATAQQQVDKLRKQAEVTLMAMATPREDNRKRYSYIALGVALVVLGLLALLVYSETSRTPSHAAGPPPAQTR